MVRLMVRNDKHDLDQLNLRNILIKTPADTKERLHVWTLYANTSVLLIHFVICYIIVTHFISPDILALD